MYRRKEDVLEDCKRKLAEHRSAQSPLDPFLRERRGEPAPAPANASSERRSRAVRKPQLKKRWRQTKAAREPLSKERKTRSAAPAQET